MASSLKAVVRRIRGMAGLPAIAECSDRQLLERFAHTGEQGAFAALVERHGPLVLGVCRRVLRNTEDAEDACQATFMVLARKAGSDFWQHSISNWLHGVAYRVALKTRTQRHRQKQRDLTYPQAAESGDNPADQITWGEMRSLLDSELARLPAKYRAPLLLCYLEGRTRDEAAAQLGWSAGSVKGRLERGRELLRQRLAKRGLTISAALCAALLPESASALPAPLAAATLEHAAAFATGAATSAAAPAATLAKGVLGSMLLTKLKVCVLACAGLGVLALAATPIPSVAIKPETSPARPTPPAPTVAATKNLPPIAPAAVESGRQPAQRGVVVSTTPAVNTIAIEVGPTAKPSIVTFQVDAGTQFFLNERPHKLTLAEIPPTARVSYQTAADGKTLTHLHVVVPTANGVLEGIDTPAGVVILRENGRLRNFKMAPSTVYRMGERPAEPGAIRPGTRVLLRLSLDGTQVESITAIVERETREGRGQ